MSPNIITVHALATLEKDAKTMKDSNIKKLPVSLNNKIIGIIKETDLSITINAFSNTIDQLMDFYADSKDCIEKILDDWGDLLINLKRYKKLSQHKKTRCYKGISIK